MVPVAELGQQSAVRPPMGNCMSGFRSGPAQRLALSCIGLWREPSIQFHLHTTRSRALGLGVDKGPSTAGGVQEVVA